MNYAIHTREFDPSDVELLFVQDEVGQAYGEWPYCYRRVDLERLTDTELAHIIVHCADALLLPLSDNFIGGINEVLLEARDVAKVRMNRRQKAEKQRREFGPSDWASADLVAEVEALCGMGKQSGKEVWFSCCFHADATPSLHVDPQTRRWHCFSCQRGGGVLDWRKAARESAR